MKKVYIIHTSLVSQAELNALFAELAPDAKVHNIIDDSLLPLRRHAEWRDHAEDHQPHVRLRPGVADNGADLIFNQCSSVGEAADIAARLVSVPVLKVDAPMAEKAVELGRRIGVATVKSTMKPSCNRVRAKAVEAGKPVEVVEYLVDGALDVLMKEKEPREAQRDGARKGTPCRGRVRRHRAGPRQHDRAVAGTAGREETGADQPAPRCRAGKEAAGRSVIPGHLRGEMSLTRRRTRRTSA